VGSGMGVAAGPQAARTRDAVTSIIANIEKRFICFSIPKVVVYLHIFCTDIVNIVHVLHNLSIGRIAL